MESKISVIMPVYNCENRLEAAIKSVIKQKDYKNFELIIVNDGSTDNSEKICDRMRNEDKRIKYFKINNSGVSNARNIGIYNASGEYLMFIDSDDLYDENIMKNMVRRT